MQKKNQMQEAASDSLFDVGISSEELKIRKISTSRVLDQAKKALDVAESTGQESIAKQLQHKITILQDWLDHADELPVSDDDSDSMNSSGGANGDDEDTEDDGSGDEGNDKELDDDSDDDSNNSDIDDDDNDNSDEDTDSEESDGSTDDEEDNDAENDNDADTEDSEELDDIENDAEDDTDGVDSNNDSEDDSEEDDSEDNASDDDGASNSSKTDSDSSDSASSSKSGSDSENSDTDNVEDDSEEDSTEEDSEEESDEEDSEKSAGSSDSDADDDTDDDAGDDSGDDSGDGSEVDDGDDDDESTEDPDEVLIDPFKNPALSEKPPKDIDPSKIESVFDAAKRILGKLTGEARRGASDGLKGLLTKRGIHVEESFLHEALSKHLAQLSDDEFHDELAATMDLVDKVIKVDYSDDLDARVAEIKRDVSSAISRMELEKEDAEHVKDEREVAKAHIKASEKENEKYSKIKGLSGLDVFKSTLYGAVKDQVEEAEDEIETWSALDRRHEDDPSIIVKGRTMDDLDGDIPSINVYFDQSGSWDEGDIEKGKRAISVINEFHENKEIKLNIYYMSAGGIFTTASAARRFGGAEGWAAALKHIKDTKVKNAIILSDEDLDHYEWSNRPTGNNGRTIIDGCVWWLWKDAKVSKKALRELIGRRGNFQYQFEGSY